MSLPYANDFAEIPNALVGNQALREAMLSLIAVQPVAGKVQAIGECLWQIRRRT